MKAYEKFMIGSAVIFLVAGFCLYSPLHPDTKEPFKTRCLLTYLKMLSFIADTSDFLGYNKYRVVQKIFNSGAEAFEEPPSEGLKTYEDLFDGVRVRIIEPIAESADLRPVLLYLHGGWFMFGSPETHFQIADKLAYDLNALVISVDYRLAPEHPFPAGFDDCYTVTKYVLKNREKLKIDSKNIGIAGDSAGGDLSAAVSLKLRDEGKFQFKYQVLIYPLVQGLTVNLPSYQFNEWQNARMLQRLFLAETMSVYITGEKRLTPFILSGNHLTEEMYQTHGHYVSVKNIPLEYIPSNYDANDYSIPKSYEESAKQKIDISNTTLRNFINPYAFPLMAESLKNMPSTLILTCEMDPLRDEGILFSERLKKDGVNVRHYHDNCFHGIMGFLRSPLSFTTAHEAVDDIVLFINSL